MASVKEKNLGPRVPAHRGAHFWATRLHCQRFPAASLGLRAGNNAGAQVHPQPKPAWEMIPLPGRNFQGLRVGHGEALIYRNPKKQVRFTPKKMLSPIAFILPVLTNDSIVC